MATSKRAFVAANEERGQEVPSEARHYLVRALYYATDGKPCWWCLPRNLNNLTKDAIDRAVDLGWILLEGHHNSVCLTDTGRDVFETTARRMPDQRHGPAGFPTAAISGQRTDQRPRLSLIVSILPRR
jgi:hypothetical protein